MNHKISYLIQVSLSQPSRFDNINRYNSSDIIKNIVMTLLKNSYCSNAQNILQSAFHSPHFHLKNNDIAIEVSRSSSSKPSEILIKPAIKSHKEGFRYLFPGETE